MIMTMIPGGVLQPDVAWAAEHTSHCVCGGSRAIGDHTEHTDITDWKEWTETTCLPNEAGSYYLTQNVEISEAWEPADGTVLCLNGHSITCTAGTNDEAISAISVESSVAFTLTDCSKDENGSNKGEITHSAGAIGRGVYNDGTFYLYGGNITGNNSGSKSFIGGGVMNDNGATFIRISKLSLRCTAEKFPEIRQTEAVEYIISVISLWMAELLVA